MNVKTTSEIVKYSSYNSNIPSEQKKRLFGDEQWVGLEELKRKVNDILNDSYKTDPERIYHLRVLIGRAGEQVKEAGR